MNKQMNDHKNNPPSIIKNENGVVMIAVVLILAIITLLGVMATKTTVTEIQASTNHQISKISLYAAEAARAYVAYNSDLYGSGNIKNGNPILFPDEADSSIKEPLSTGASQSYNGEVEYVSASIVPRGSGFQVGKFKAHVYQMECIGYGPRDSETRIEAGFYRIGF